MIQNLSQAIERVNSIYLTGTIEFYAKLSPDPWQQAHDELEGWLSMCSGSENYFDEMLFPLNLFVSTVEELLERYRPFSVGAKSSAPSLGFYAGDVATAAERFSIQEKVCGGCTSRENLKARKSPRTGKPMILCDVCAGGR